MVAVRRFGPLLVGALLLATYLARLDYHELAVHIDAFRWWAGAGVLVLNLVPGLLKLARWRILTGPVDVGLGRRYLAVNAGFFLGLVTPGTAGELARGLLVGDRSPRLLGTLLLEKVTDLGTLCLFALFAGVASVAPANVASLLCAAILVLAIGVVWLGLRFDSVLTAVPRIMLRVVLPQSRLQDTKQAYWEFHRFASNRVLLASSALFSSALWLVSLAQMYLIFQGLGASAPLRTIALVYFLPYLVGVVSMIPLGIGVFELGAGNVSAALGSNAASAALIPLLFRALVTLPLIVFGYVCHLILVFNSRHADPSEKSGVAT
jgi:glycosyltransferase 2 family protein